MSDYSKVTNFTAKDNLSSGDASKRINGALFDSEFNPIATAIASKVDKVAGETGEIPKFTSSGGIESSGITLAGIQTLITAAAAAANPVGSIYSNAAVATNPGTLLGFGTWVAFGAGRVMVGFDTSDTDFDAVEETGGAKTHTLLVSELPSHTHRAKTLLSTIDGVSGADPVRSDGSFGADPGLIESTGGGGAHNNLQPYITVYMWKRTA